MKDYKDREDEKNARKAIGIDFGTSSIKIYKNGEGVILHQKSVIAIYKKNHVFAVGDEAFEMYEKAPENLDVSYRSKMVLLLILEICRH